MIPFADRLIEIFGSRHTVACASGLSNAYLSNLLQGRRKFSLHAATCVREAAGEFGIQLPWHEFPLSQRALRTLIETGDITLTPKAHS